MKSLAIGGLLVLCLCGCEREVVLVPGEGRLALAPDYVTVSGSVEATGATPGEATTAVTKKVHAVLDGLERAHFNSDVRQVKSYFARQHCETERTSAGNIQRCQGYEAGQSFSIELSDLPRTGELLALLADLGLDYIGDPQFDVRDRAAALAKAQQAAVDDARKDAEVYATRAGRKLGRVLRIEDQETKYSRFTKLAGATIGSRRILSSTSPTVAVAISIQDVDVSRAVYVEFALE